MRQPICLLPCNWQGLGLGTRDHHEEVAWHDPPPTYICTHTHTHTPSTQWLRYLTLCSVCTTYEQTWEMCKFSVNGCAKGEGGGSISCCMQCSRPSRQYRWPCHHIEIGVGFMSWYIIHPHPHHMHTPTHWHHMHTPTTTTTYKKHTHN